MGAGGTAPTGTHAGGTSTTGTYAGGTSATGTHAGGTARTGTHTGGAGGTGSGARRMTDDVLEEFVRQYIGASTGPDVYFTWHGGEPTLAGLDFYITAARLQKKYAEPGKRCVNNLQTNGILLNDEWCAFLSEEKFTVGLSLDGNQRAHDYYRKDRAGNGTYEKAAAAVRRLQSYGIQPDLLCTVTPRTAADPLSVYRALRDLDTGWIQFIPVVKFGADGVPAPYSVSADEYGDFLCEVFDEWISRDIGRTDVQLFAETAAVWAGSDAGLCWMSRECGGALAVEADGGVYSCDHYVKPDYLLGNIRETPLSELVRAPEQLRFGCVKFDSLPARCVSCRWLKPCNGGCPKDRAAPADNGVSGLNVLCEGLKRFFAHSEQPLKKASELARGGMGPGAIMRNVRVNPYAAAKNAGRNDPCPCGSGKKAKNCCLLY